MRKKTICGILIFICIVLILYFLIIGFNKLKYNDAVKAAESGDYETAISLMEELGDKVNKDEVIELKYLYAINSIEKQDYETAEKLLEDVGNYKESDNLKLEIDYQKAKKIARDDGILEALPLYEKLPENYKDVAEIIDRINEWSVYNDTWSIYYKLINMTDVCQYTIYFDEDKVYCKGSNWRTDLDKLEIVNNETKFSFNSMEFFVDGMIIAYDGSEFTNWVKGVNANAKNSKTVKSSEAFNVSIRDTIKGTTNPDADDYYEKKEAGDIIEKKKKEYNKMIQEHNAVKEPAIGMTESEVENSTWGKPEKINKTTYAWGTHEQWCYSNYRYIYFEDGKVTAISE